MTRWDPFGLQQNTRIDGNGVVVTGSFDNPSDHPSFNPMPGFGPLGSPAGGGPGGEPGIGYRTDNPEQIRELERINQELERLSNELSAPPPQNPPSPGDQSTNPGTSSASPTQAQITSQVLQAVVVTSPTGVQYMPTTWIKNSAQAEVLRRSVFSRVPIFVPPGQNPQATINRWSRTTFPSNLQSFYNAFNPWTGSMNFKLGNPIFDAYRREESLRLCYREWVTRSMAV